MKKIIISTFNNSDNSYGALFQSASLSAFLKKLSYEPINVTIINRSNKNVSLTIKIKRKIKKFLQRKNNQNFYERKSYFRAFAKETQNQLIYKNEEELFNNPPQGDVYLSGSDQVWNPVSFRKDFFLDYVSDDKKKISYAASMGVEIIPETNVEKFGKYISRFNHISVREDTMVDIIQKFTEKKIYQNIDPVFLQSKSEWLSLSKEYTGIKYDKFILAFVLSWDNAYNKALEQLKSETGLPVVSINSGNIANIPADQVLYDVSPNQFLDILNKTDFVVTTSFHGTAMSVIFNKKFTVVTGKFNSSRVDSLLRHFSLSGIENFNQTDKEIDYDKINEIIENDIKESRDYLIDAIEN